MHVSGITVYPIKSLGGIALDYSAIEERGLPHDRRWMLVDAQGQFLTQRKIARMALFKVALRENSLRVQYPDFPELAVPFVPEGEQMRVTVWEDTCEALAVSPAADQWFSDALQMHCRLVYMPDQSRRRVDERYNTDDYMVSFADGFPFLLIGQASLDDLNSRLPEPVPMNRFRPNLVIQTTEPFIEDTWQSIRIGEALFHVKKPCARCVLTTIDQQTAAKGPEPLRTLSTYRRIHNKVLFGQNLVFGRQGNSIRVGDRVEVVGS
jgi:uncharacterized protein